jgi:hypothetical protein
VLILLGAAVLTGAIGDLNSAFVIAIVVLLNAALTGESHAVAKSPDAVDEKSALAERRYMTRQPGALRSMPQ